MKEVWFKANGVWKKTTNVWVKANGVWKSRAIPKGYIGGVLKEFKTYGEVINPPVDPLPTPEKRYIELFTSGTITNSNDNYTSVFNTYYEDNRSETLILKTDLEAAGFSGAGVIQELSFFYTQTPGRSLKNVKIGIKQTNTMTFESTYSFDTYESYTEVYKKDLIELTQLLVPNNWFTFPINNFLWDGISNIQITILRDDDNYADGGAWRVVTNPAYGRRHKSWRADSDLPSPFNDAAAGPGLSVPSIKLGITPGTKPTEPTEPTEPTNPTNPTEPPVSGSVLFVDDFEYATILFDQMYYISTGSSDLIRSSPSLTQGNKALTMETTPNILGYSSIRLIDSAINNGLTKGIELRKSYSLDFRFDDAKQTLSLEIGSASDYVAISMNNDIIQITEKSGGSNDTTFISSSRCNLTVGQIYTLTFILDDIIAAYVSQGNSLIGVTNGTALNLGAAIGGRAYTLIAGPSSSGSKTYLAGKVTLDNFKER